MNRREALALAATAPLAADPLSIWVTSKPGRWVGPVKPYESRALKHIHFMVQVGDDDEYCPYFKTNAKCVFYFYGATPEETLQTARECTANRLNRPLT